MNKPPDAFIFMKVGNHAGESFESILRRKNEEFKKAGKIFWGYGGTACHPITQVQPFVNIYEKENGSVYVLMQEIDSRAEPLIAPAKQYSVDGINWQDIPDGINVIGSRYALVLDEIKSTDFDINPQEFEIGAGPSAGKNAEDYMKGHIDKACLIKSNKNKENESPKVKKIKLAAKLIAPYAVLLKGE
ncbi:MAG TPA: hypothetical protein VK892_22290 [Pyrinomonadaceae bacterium]|nr:hypothetical protein [Pyrinomonadaceae bacterium]